LHHLGHAPIAPPNSPTHLDIAHDQSPATEMTPTSVELATAPVSLLAHLDTTLAPSPDQINTAFALSPLNRAPAPTPAHPMTSEISIDH
jgi:hypothetical protein